MKANVLDVTPCGVVDLYKCVAGLATGSSNVDIHSVTSQDRRHSHCCEKNLKSHTYLYPPGIGFQDFKAC